MALLSWHRAPDAVASPAAPGTRRRRHTYIQDVIAALVFIWKACDCIGSKRLPPFLPEMVRVLEDQGELHLPEQTKQVLLTMSRATDIQLYVTFFQPVAKLVGKTCLDRKVLTAADVSQDRKDALMAPDKTLNPVALYGRIQTQLRHIWEAHSIPDDMVRKPREVTNAPK